MYELKFKKHMPHIWWEMLVPIHSPNRPRAHVSAPPLCCDDGTTLWNWCKKAVYEPI